MDLTCPADNKVREITGKSVRDSVEKGLSREEIIQSIRKNIKLQLGKDSSVEGLNINLREHEFTALVQIEGRRGAVLVADDMDVTCPAANRIREVTQHSIRKAIEEGARRKGIIESIERNIKQELGREGRVEGLSVNIEDNEFTALIVVTGRRGAIPVGGSIS